MLKLPTLFLTAMLVWLSLVTFSLGTFSLAWMREEICL